MPRPFEVVGVVMGMSQPELEKLDPVLDKPASNERDARKSFLKHERLPSRKEGRGCDLK